MTAVPGRTVNVHEAKTQFSRLIDAAHAGKTIVVAQKTKERSPCISKVVIPVI